jgi:two-component system, NarL family, response regulator
MSNTGAVVYVVDDDACARDGVADLIRSAGLRAKTFASGEEFLTAARREPPSCLVLDVKLPGVSGLDVQEELAKSDVQVPIIFLTGYGDVPTTVRAVKAGAMNVLTKPFDDEVLLKAVRQCITRCDEERLHLESTRTRTGIVSGTSSPIRILAVDDHPLMREGIAGLVGVQPDMTLVGQAADGRDAIQQFRTHRPDVTLMDIQMPQMNGLDALIAIRTEFPDARVIVLTTYEGDVLILRALKAGAQGYLLKNTLHSELLQTIRAVHGGKRSLSPEASFQIAQHVSEETLTPAEVVVLRLIAGGNANKQIADQLGITEDTVKGRVKSILAKLDANDRTRAAIIGLKRGIIELQGAG